jgi:hypothetical protein
LPPSYAAPTASYNRKGSDEQGGGGDEGDLPGSDADNDRGDPGVVDRQ